jgi:hypothetical protein
MLVISIIVFVAVAYFGFVILKHLKRRRAEAKWREDITKLFGCMASRLDTYC